MNLGRFFKLYSENFKAEVSGISAYRTSFFLNVLSLIIDSILGPLTALIIYSVTPGFQGWTLPEIFVFMGCFSLIVGLAHLLVLGFSWVTADLIIDGSFDTLLLKPVNTLGYMLGKVIDFDGISQISSGVIIMLIGLINLNYVPSIMQLIIFSVFVLDGFLMWFAMSVFTGALCFKFQKAHELTNLLFRFADFANYPINIYGSLLSFIFTFVIPLGVISYYPAQALLGRLNDASLLLGINAVLITIVILCVTFYNKSLRNYSSAGG